MNEKMQKHTSDFIRLPVLFIVDEKAMIRSRYNRIPHPSPDTIGERNTNNQDGISGKPRGQLFPNRFPPGQPVHNQQIVKD